MTIQESYDLWSASYDQDQNLTRDLDAALTRKSLEGERFRFVLELGPGTGKNTALLAQIGDSVLGMDFSQGMLKRARQKVRASNVRFIRTDITRPWPLPASVFDLLVCNLVLEHVQDPGLVFIEAARVMAPGAVFHLSELHPFRQYLGGRAQYQTGSGRAGIPAHIHHISDFIQAAQAAGLHLADLQEAWHDEDEGRPPRLIVFKFIKRPS